MGKGAYAGADAEEGRQRALVEGEGALPRPDLARAVEGGGVLLSGLQTDLYDVWTRSIGVGSVGLRLTERLACSASESACPTSPQYRQHRDGLTEEDLRDAAHGAREQVLGQADAAAGDRGVRFRRRLWHDRTTRSERNWVKIYMQNIFYGYRAARTRVTQMGKKALRRCDVVACSALTRLGPPNSGSRLLRLGELYLAFVSEAPEIKHGVFVQAFVLLRVGLPIFLRHDQSMGWLIGNVARFGCL